MDLSHCAVKGSGALLFEWSRRRFLKLVRNYFLTLDNEVLYILAFYNICPTNRVHHKHPALVSEELFMKANGVISVCKKTS